MSSDIRRLINIVSEVQSAEHSEYDDVIRSQFTPQRAPDFLDMTQGSVDMFMNAYPSTKKHTKKSDSGNFYVQWLENDDTVAIVGIVASSGKITKQDYPDFLEFVDMLLDRLDSGKKVLASPNRKSSALIDKIQKLAKHDRGMMLSIHTTPLGSVLGGDSNDPELDFEQVVITATK